MPDRRKTLDWGSLILPLLIAPLLLFPRLDWIWLAGLVPLWWGADLLLNRRWLDKTPFNLLLGLLLFMVLVSLFATFDVAFSLPKVSGLILGVYVFFGLVRWTDRPERLALAAAAFCLGGAALALIGLVGTDWKDKFAIFQGLERWLPTRLTGLPGAESGFNANAVGGSMILFLPLLFLIARESRRGHARLSHTTQRCVQAAAWTAVVLLTLVLVLSQSRGAWLGLTGASVILAWLRFRRVRRAGWVALPLAAALLLWYPSDLAEWLVGPSGGDLQSIGLNGRIEIWNRALFAIQDFPFIGMGMNAFRKAVPLLYPFFSVGPGKDIASAHNHVLQAALDLGIPGMVAYLALWSALARTLYEVWRFAQDRAYRILALGLAHGLLAQFIFQITDAIPLGAKVGIFFWIALGLAASLWKISGAAGSSRPDPRGGLSALEVLLTWSLVSLLSVALVGEYPAAGLGTGVAGGIFLGYLAAGRFSTSRPRPRQSSL
ncbi:MAG: O-antigen ligase family protein [Acidobacteriota bacterium]